MGGVNLPLLGENCSKNQEKVQIDQNIIGLHIKRG